MKTHRPARDGSNRSRRDFLRKAAVGAATAGLPLAHASASASPSNSANEKLGVGFIGVGGRGNAHLRTVQQLIDSGEPLEMVAVCDAYRPRLEAAAKKTGGKMYRRHGDLLADKNVDVVCIATPDRHHVPQAIDAIQAGKDVYCEKPMGHWSQFELSKRFYHETRQLQRIVQIGNQGNSSNAWRKAGALIRSGAIGNIQHVQAGYYRDGDWGERMRIPDPNARPGPDLDWKAFLGDAPDAPFSVERFFSWRAFLDYAGGPCTDLFPHVLTPFISMLGLAFPSRAVSSGGIFKYDDYYREVPDTFNMCVDYPERLSIVLVCTLTNQFPTEPAIRGDEGAITLQEPKWERGFRSVTLHPKRGAPKVIEGENPDSTLEHWKNFLHCVRTREKPVSDVEFGYHVQTALNMAMLAYLQEKVARFDAEREEIVL